MIRASVIRALVAASSLGAVAGCGPHYSAPLCGTDDDCPVDMGCDAAGFCESNAIDSCGANLGGVCTAGISLDYTAAVGADCQPRVDRRASPLVDLAFESGELVGYLVGTAPAPTVLDRAYLYFRGDDGEPIPGLADESDPAEQRIGGVFSTEPSAVRVPILTDFQRSALALGAVGGGLELDASPNGGKGVVEATLQVASGGVVSNPLKIAIQLCHGCLVPECERPMQLVSPGCTIGQDQVATCVEPEAP